MGLVIICYLSYQCVIMRTIVSKNILLHNYCTLILLLLFENGKTVIMFPGVSLTHSFPHSHNPSDNVSLQVAQLVVLQAAVQGLQVPIGRKHKR